MNTQIIQLTEIEGILEFYPILKQLFDDITVDSIRESVEDLMNKGAKFVGLYVDNQPVGFMQFSQGNNLTNYKYFILDELVVDDQYRSKGYGTKLLEYLENEAMKLGVSGIGLLSGLSLEKAHNFYQKNGY